MHLAGADVKVYSIQYFLFADTGVQAFDLKHFSYKV